MTLTKSTIIHPVIGHNRSTSLGECYVFDVADPDKPFFVPIPKNASKFSASFLRAGQCHIENYHNKKYYDRGFVAILRDPVERWVSGTAEYFDRKFTNLDFEKDLDMCKAFMLEKLKSEQIAFDEHTDPQVKFLSQLDKTNGVYLWFDSRLSDNFFDLFKGLVRTPHNTSKLRPPRKLSLLNTIQDIILQEPDLKEKVIAFYEEDFDLIKSVKYHSQIDNSK